MIILKPDSQSGFSIMQLSRGYLQKKLYPKMVTAYVIHWVPEQEEDFYRILVNDDIIAEIELDHDEAIDPIAESVTISQYISGLRKNNQIQLAVALDLAREDMKKP